MHPGLLEGWGSSKGGPLLANICVHAFKDSLCTQKQSFFLILPGSEKTQNFEKLNVCTKISALWGNGGIAGYNLKKGNELFSHCRLALHSSKNFSRYNDLPSCSVAKYAEVRKRKKEELHLMHK